MKLNKIIVIANKYPNNIEPNVNVFTQQITWSFVDQGCDCIVINPIAINYKIKNFSFPFKRVEITESGKKITIYHPKYIGFGQNNKFLLKLRVDITTKLFIKAVNSVLRKMNLKNCILFGEFLCPAGVAASMLGAKYNIKSYMQCGEATYQGDLRYGNKKLADKWLKDITSIICLSSYNKNYLLNAGVVPPEKIYILPSGYRKDRIFKRDKVEARKRLGLPDDKFIVGFCGTYGKRKGVLRLQQAIDSIDDEQIVFAAVGKGEGEPTSRRCVLKGPINHSELGWFYSAIDVFAFPTYFEGCCTAIVEAIACGCPIITSDREFNYDICDKSNAILIEPDDIAGMANAIKYLKNNTQVRRELSNGSVEKSKNLSLDDKAQKMIHIFET